MSLYSIIVTIIAIIAPVIAYSMGEKSGVRYTIRFFFPSFDSAMLYLFKSKILTPEEKSELQKYINKKSNR